MLTSDPDQYYTPPIVADVVANALNVVKPKTVLDSACGNGRLLEAAQGIFPSVRCVGIDRDDSAIRLLQKRRPKWTLLVGDSLDRDVWSSRIEGSMVVRAEVAVLNPPFSMGANKGQLIEVWGMPIRCSLAMAHVVRSLEQSLATVAVAIVPESWAYSELDEQARALLGKRYTIEVLSYLRSSTFSRTRANTLIVRLEANKRKDALVETLFTPPRQERTYRNDIQIIRGGLPVFEAKSSKRGVPYIHSTDLSSLQQEGGASALTKVRPLMRGLIEGHVILLPRVGIPQPQFVKEIRLDQTCQLSDCVVALRAPNLRSAKALSNVLINRFGELQELYRGTGARYITVAKLTAWAATL